jgi:hypothetical protein
MSAPPIIEASTIEAPPFSSTFHLSIPFFIHEYLTPPPYSAHPPFHSSTCMTVPTNSHNDVALNKSMYSSVTIGHECAAWRGARML